MTDTPDIIESAATSQDNIQGSSGENQPETPAKRTDIPKAGRSGQRRGRSAKKGSNPPSQSVVSAPVDDMGEKGNDETPAVPRPRNKRGRRGGKGKPSRHLDSVGKPGLIFVSPLELAERLLSVPALPPGMALISQKSQSGSPLPVKRQKTELKRMFISVWPGEQVEVALDENGTVLEYYLDMLHQCKLKGNIYKGIVQNIDTNLQAAFVNYGAEKNGFLQITEVHPEYWQTAHDSNEKLPPIQKILKLGQEILVQVVKEPAGSKGAFLTTWLSLAGRFLVLTPGQEQIGVSRKVTDQEERTRLREMMNGIDPGNGMGVIVRTVGEGATKTTLKNDLQYLKRLWRDIRKNATELSAPALLHQEPGLSERSVRDYLTEDVSEIWVDNAREAENVRAMVALLFPRKKNLVRLYEDKGQNIWEHFGLASQLEQIYSREIPLPSGGRLVFDQTEALMAIDINSGKISGKGNFENMAYKTNMEAAESIPRQLRLRDIGGQVVIDFIEMRDKKHVLEVEKKLRSSMKNDRARHDVSRMSSFGLLELVRQRMGSSALSLSMEVCSACGGTGLRRNLEWQALHLLKELRQKLKASSGLHVTFDAPRELGLYVLNHKRDALRMLEQDFGKTLAINIQI